MPTDSDTDWREECTEIWPDPVPPNLELELRLYGCPVDPYFGHYMDNARNLAGAGFTRDQIERIFNHVKPIDLAGVFKRLSKSLPEILDLHASGFTVQQISDMIDVPRGVVYYYLDQRHLTPNRVNAEPLTPEQVGVAMTAYRKGQSIASIARGLGATERQIGYALRGVKKGKKKK